MPHINSQSITGFFINGFALLAATFAPTPLMAEHLCNASISFSVKKTQEEAEREVYWTRLERKGVDEAAAKAALTDAIAAETPRALAGCQEAHENLAGCVSSKFTALSTTLQRLSFTQRKSIEDAVNADCNSRQGRCGAVKNSEIVCSLLVVASSSSSSVETKDAKKKK